MYTDQDHQVDSKILDPLFKKLDVLIEGESYEVEQLKSAIEFNLPLQVGYFVYQYAKMRMLEFYYDFLLKYFDERDFQLMYCDTDSAYAAFSHPQLDTIVKPDMITTFNNEKHLWLPRDDSEEHALVDKYRPGLFKVEFTGDEMICLNSKTYFCSDNESNSSKYSCKGVSTRLNKIEKEMYATVMETKVSQEGTNKGFRLVDGDMMTYTQSRKAFTYLYIKREVLEDGVSTKPIPL